MSKFATKCVVCGCALSGGTDTFGTIDTPLCLDDNLLVTEEPLYLSSVEIAQMRLSRSENEFASSRNDACTATERIIAMRKYRMARYAKQRVLVAAK